ncbi:MAG: transaldolase, partial [Caldilinea sp.]|nr:transaldolase [Caldilinea sp.]
QLIADGININVTLIFSLDRYADVKEAYLQGLEERMKAGKPVDRAASVASFFVSRVDVNIDGQLDKLSAAHPADA